MRHSNNKPKSSVQSVGTLTPPALEIRNATEKELKRVANVIKEAYEEYAVNFSPEGWRGYSENIQDVASRFGKAEILVAVKARKIVGTLTLYPNGKDNDWPARWAGLRLLAVAPAYRGQGIARALMDKAIARSRKRGSTTIGLHTTEMMAVAQQIYIRMGFARAPRYDFHPRPGMTVMAYKMPLRKTRSED